MKKRLYCKNCKEKVLARIVQNEKLATAWCSDCGNFIISGTIDDNLLIKPDVKSDILIPKICPHCEKKIIINFQNGKYDCEYCDWNGDQIHIPPKYAFGILVKNPNCIASFRKWTGEIIEKNISPLPKSFLKEPGKYIDVNLRYHNEGVLILTKIRTWSIDTNIITQLNNYILKKEKSFDNLISERLPAGVLSKLEKMV